MAVAFLCVFGCSRGWPVTFETLVGALLIYCFFFVSPLYTDHMNNQWIFTLQGGNLVSTYLCFCIKYSLIQGSFETLLGIQNFAFLFWFLVRFLVSKERCLLFVNVVVVIIIIIIIDSTCFPLKVINYL